MLGALVACAALVLVGSPWVGGKALATASPAIPFAAMLGVGWLAGAGRGVAAGALALVIVGGVVWSNALGYGDVSLAPRSQLAELERIGELVAGEGPTLMTEYEPYGVRHFLRDADPEGISELRRRTIPLRDGTTVEKGGFADTDEVDPLALGYYRTLVLRRSPAQSRPPSPYRLVWRGEAYEAWQRPVERLAAARAPAARRSLRPVRDAGLRQGAGARRARRPGRGRRRDPGDRAALRGALPGLVGDPGDPLRTGAADAGRDRGPGRDRAPGRIRDLARRLPAARRSSCWSTAGRPARSAISSTTAASTCGSARQSSVAGRTRSRSGSAVPTCTRAAPGTRARSGRWC